MRNYALVHAVDRSHIGCHPIHVIEGYGHRRLYFCCQAEEGVSRKLLGKGMGAVTRQVEVELLERLEVEVGEVKVFR